MTARDDINRTESAWWRLVLPSDPMEPALPAAIMHWGNLPYCALRTRCKKRHHFEVLDRARDHRLVSWARMVRSRLVDPASTGEIGTVGARRFRAYERGWLLTIRLFVRAYQR